MDLINEVKKLLLCCDFQSELEFDMKLILKEYEYTSLSESAVDEIVNKLSTYFNTLKPNKIYDYIINRIEDSKYLHELDIQVHCHDMSVYAFNIGMRS
jgi:hypothetical protein